MLEVLRILKRRFYQIKYGLRNVHKTFIACADCTISKDFKAGAYSYVGPGCTIYPKVTLGKYSMIANDVHILGGDHRFDIPDLPIIFSGRGFLKETVIGDDVWIGAYSVIMSGVHIGNGAIIAAGSVVSKDVPPYTVLGGVNKVIKMRFNNQDDIDKHEAMLSLDYTSLPKDVRLVLRGK